MVVTAGLLDVVEGLGGLLLTEDTGAKPAGLTLDLGEVVGATKVLVDEGKITDPVWTFATGCWIAPGFL